MYEDLLVRCSSLSKIMGQCKESITPNQLATLKKLEEKGEDITSKQKGERTRLQTKVKNKPEFDLSEGAKTYIKGIVKKDVYKYTIHVETDQMIKGTMCEQDSIDLYNSIFYTDHKKNEVRIYGKYLQGECDVNAPTKIQDYKTSWTKHTFPALPEEIEVGGYEWQGRGYMMLYNKPKFELVYGLVDTPDQLLEYVFDLTPHHVEDIAPELRITTLMFDRCLEKEELIKHKVRECRKYAAWYEKQIQNKFN